VKKHEIIGAFTLQFKESELPEEFWDAHDKEDKDMVGFFKDALEMEMQMWISHIFGSPLDITFHSSVSIEEN
jgi:hypothetical protein